jgi:hypothetical protein
MDLTLILLGAVLLAAALHGLLGAFGHDEWPTTTKEGDKR